MKSITIESLYDLVFLDDPQISPDGSRVAFMYQSVNRPGNGYTRNIWLADLGAPAGVDDATPRPYTGGAKDANPRWSEDGRFLGFLSGRSGPPAVFALPTAGGEAQSIASHRNGISGFEWSRDGARIAFIASTHEGERADEERPAPAPDPTQPPKDDWALKRDKDQRDRDEQLRLDPRVLKFFPYRTGTSFFEDRFKHIYAADVPPSFAAKNDAKPRRLTDGNANYDAAHWLPDGQAVVSYVTRDPDSGNMTRLRDAVIVPLDQPGEGPRNLTRLARPGYSVFEARPSPDGEWIAVLTAADADPGYNLTSIAVISVKTGEAIDLTRAMDRCPVRFKWSRDSRHIYFSAEADGRINLWRVSVPDGTVEQLTRDDHDVTAFDVDAQGRIVFVAATSGDPSALYLREADGALRALFQPNSALLSDTALGQVESFWFDSDGFKVQGWLVMPPGFDPAKRYPLLVEIHGGPHQQWTGNTPSMWHEFQTAAARGYVVFYCNPRGSDGYGEAYTTANIGDWGEGPARDVLRGVEAVVARGFVDSSRMAMTGGSYGGYLTGWIIGHDHRFAAACTQRGVYNLISMRGTTDLPFFNDRETGATPWSDAGRLWGLSPLAYVPEVQTPVLIEHSEQDYRVPIEQAEQYFAALKLHKKAVELVRWPREGHEVSRSGEPRHRTERIRRMLEWFDRYCTPPAA